MGGIRTTTEHLVLELTEKNKDGKYDEIIEKAKAGHYHDFKSSATMPKVQLTVDLGRFPELAHLRNFVIGGMYDEPADDADKESLRKALSEDGASEEDLKSLGL